MTWDKYISNTLSYDQLLNPIGILRGLNTRAYEAIYSGRMLYQHTIGTYERHEKMLEGYKNVKFVRDVSDFQNNITQAGIIDPKESFEKNSIFARMKSIGVKIK
jgi:hypothetical protein